MSTTLVETVSAPCAAPFAAAAGRGSRAVHVLTELRSREPILAGLGLAFAALLLPAAFAWGLDPRTIQGVSVWVKPMKFLASLALFALTTAWFFGYLPAARRHARPARAIVWTIVGAALFEIVYITVQAARGEASHFNDSTLFHQAMYGLMGVGALLLTGTMLLLAREVARHGDPALDPAYRLSVVLGLVLTFVLGAAAGAYMSAQPGHGVGGVPGGPGLPVVGWSATGGDLRVAHFFGIHAQQLLPLAGALLARLWPRRVALGVWAFAIIYAVFTVATFVQAARGLPFLAL